MVWVARYLVDWLIEFIGSFVDWIIQLTQLIQLTHLNQPVN